MYFLAAIAISQSGPNQQVSNGWTRDKLIAELRSKSYDITPYKGFYQIKKGDVRVWGTFTQTSRPSKTNTERAAIMLQFVTHYYVQGPINQDELWNSNMRMTQRIDSVVGFFGRILLETHEPPEHFEEGLDNAFNDLGHDQRQAFYECKWTAQLSSREMQAVDDKKCVTWLSPEDLGILFRSWRWKGWAKNSGGLSSAPYPSECPTVHGVELDILSLSRCTPTTYGIEMRAAVSKTRAQTEAEWLKTNKAVVDLVRALPLGEIEFDPDRVEIIAGVPFSNGITPAEIKQRIEAFVALVMCVKGGLPMSPVPEAIGSVK